MQVTFLGTGSAMPTGERYQTGIVLEDGDQTLLIDCGSGVLQRLQQYGPGYEAVSTILLTHHHLDHVADLMVLAKARWLAGETDLTIVGPPGTEALVKDLFATHDYMQDRLDLAVRDIDSGEHTVAGFDLAAMSVRHSMPCYAYRFGDQFAFSGDSEAFVDLAAFLDGVAVAAHDCSFPDTVDVDNHPTPEQLGEVLTEAGVSVDELYLTHLYPHTEGNHGSMLESLTEAWDGTVAFAEDGLTVTID